MRAFRLAENIKLKMAIKLIRDPLNSPSRPHNSLSLSLSLSSIPSCLLIIAPKPSYPNYDSDSGYNINQKGPGEESENTSSNYGQSPGASPISSGAIISPPRRSDNEYRSTTTSRLCPIYEWKTDSKKEEDVDDDDDVKKEVDGEDVKEEADGEEGKEKEKEGKEKEKDGEEAKPEENNDEDDEEENKDEE